MEVLRSRLPIPEWGKAHTCVTTMDSVTFHEAQRKALIDDRRVQSARAGGAFSRRRDGEMAAMESRAQNIRAASSRKHQEERSRAQKENSRMVEKLCEVHHDSETRQASVVEAASQGPVYPVQESTNISMRKKVSREVRMDNEANARRIGQVGPVITSTGELIHRYHLQKDIGNLHTRLKRRFDIDLAALPAKLPQVKSAGSRGGTVERPPWRDPDWKEQGAPTPRRLAAARPKVKLEGGAWQEPWKKSLRDPASPKEQSAAEAAQEEQRQQQQQQQSKSASYKKRATYVDDFEEASDDDDDNDIDEDVHAESDETAPLPAPARAHQRIRRLLTARGLGGKVKFFQLSLLWDKESDLDLYFILPNGEECGRSHKHEGPFDFGEDTMDVSPDNPGIETIEAKGRLGDGSYRAEVEIYSREDRGDVKWEAIACFGEERTEYSCGTFDGASEDNSRLIICEFEVVGGRAQDFRSADQSNRRRQETATRTPTESDVDSDLEDEPLSEEADSEERTASEESHRKAQGESDKAQAQLNQHEEDSSQYSDDNYSDDYAEEEEEQKKDEAESAHKEEGSLEDSSEEEQEDKDKSEIQAETKKQTKGEEDEDEEYDEDYDEEPAASRGADEKRTEEKQSEESHHHNVQTLEASTLAASAVVGAAGRAAVTVLAASVVAEAGEGAFQAVESEVEEETFEDDFEEEELPAAAPKAQLPKGGPAQTRPAGEYSGEFEED